MNLVFHHKQKVADWVSGKIGCEKWTSHFEAIGMERDGDLIGGVVLDGYVPNARCSLHVAGSDKRWINREYIRIVFDYVFNQLGCKVIVSPVSSANEAALRFDKHIGFTEVARIRDGYPDGDLVLLQMHRDDCRWLKQLEKSK